MGDPANAILRHRFARRILTFVAAAGVSLASASGPGLAATGDNSSTAATDSGSDQSSVSKYFSDWFVRSDRAKESQPH